MNIASTPPLKLSIEQVDFYKTNGYLVISDFFSKTELTDFKQALEKTIAVMLRRAERADITFVASHFIGRELDDGMEALEKIDHAYVADVYDIIAQTPEFMRIIGKREIAQVVNQLLYKDVSAPLYGFTNRCRIDPPRDTRRTYGWHQEVFYTIPETEFIQTWAPLIRDTHQGNGTIEVCEGSHKEGIARQYWNEVPGRALQIVVAEEVVRKYPQRRLDMPLGDLLLFSGKLFHQSGSNSSAEHRYSLVGMYHDVEAPGFRPAGISFNYKNGEPRKYYDDMMKKHS